MKELLVDYHGEPLMLPEDDNYRTDSIGEDFRRERFGNNKYKPSKELKKRRAKLARASRQRNRRK